MATRIQDTEASVGEKVFLFEAIGNAAQGLANQKLDHESGADAEGKKQQSTVLE